MKSNIESQTAIRRSSFSRITFRDQTKHQFYTKLLSAFTSSIFFSILLVILIRLLGFKDQPEQDIPDYYFYFGLVLLFCSIGVLVALNLKKDLREVYPKNLYTISAFQLLTTIAISLLIVHVSPENIYLACYLTLFSFLAVSLIGYGEMVDLSSPTLSYLSGNVSLMCLSIIYLMVSYFVEINIHIVPLILNYFVLVLVHSYIFFKTKTLLEKDIVTLSSSSKAESRRIIVKTMCYIYAGLVSFFVNKFKRFTGSKQPKDIEKNKTDQKSETRIQNQKDTQSGQIKGSS